MSCDGFEKLIPLYYYGELPPEDEDGLLKHLYGCAGCARELERYQALARAMDRRVAEPPAPLLEECRAGLMDAIHGGAAARREPVARSLRARLLEIMRTAIGSFGRLGQPVGAVGLLAAGFFVARVMGPAPVLAPSTTASDNPTSQVYTTVRSVQPDASGAVTIGYEETRRRELTGRMEDPAVQNLLLAGVNDENPAVRVESVDLLKAHANSGEIRAALMNALTHDGNPGVRLKALEGLKPQASQPDVRQALLRALMADDNPAVRTQVVDLLVSHRDNSMVGAFQSLMQNENDEYVRRQCERALKDMNASIGVF